jgi:pyrimidine deaminase RibD-like protein
VGSKVTMSKRDEDFMKLAIEEAKKCISVQSAFNVGAVLTRNGEILAKGYSRELEGNTHAEECCFLKFIAADRLIPPDSVIYTTMEPCGKRLSGKKSCAEHIIHHNIKKVVQGVKEPITFVGDSIGTNLLRDAGVKVVYLDGFQQECLAVNSHLKL